MFTEYAALPLNHWVLQSYEYITFSITWSTAQPHASILRIHLMCLNSQLNKFQVKMLLWIPKPFCCDNKSHLLFHLCTYEESQGAAR